MTKRRTPPTPSSAAKPAPPAEADASAELAQAPPGRSDATDSPTAESTAADSPATDSPIADSPAPDSPAPDSPAPDSPAASPAADPRAARTPWRPSRVLIGTSIAAGIAVIGGLLVATVAGGGSGSSTSTAGTALGETQAINVTSTSCADGWSLARSGAASFAITNSAAKSVEVTLRSTVDDGIIAEIESLPAQLTRQVSTIVNPGSYYWVCQFRGGAKNQSAAINVTGPTVPVAEPLLQVTADDMKDPVAKYRAYVAGQLKLLKTQTAALRADLAAGNTAKARADWLTAHQTYHRVGAAYDAFGEDGESVDGLAQGLPGGVSDKDFTGFHKIERLLWSGTAPAGIVPLADELVATVGTLETKLPSFTFDPNDISLRTHEILEGTARFQFTGADDYGSGSSLATAQADIDGTRTLVTILTPLLRTRSPDLPAQLTAQLDTLQAAVQATRSGTAWKPVRSLSLAQRQRINAATGAVLESLSVVPDMLEIRG